MNRIINEISFEKSKMILKDFKIQKNSILKIVLIYFIGIIMSIASFQSTLIIGILNVSVLTGIVIYYIKSTVGKTFLKQYYENLVFFLLIQYIWIFFLASVKTDDGSSSGSIRYYLIYLTYMVVSSLIIYLYCKSLVLKKINKLNLSNSGLENNSSFSSVITKLLIATVVIIVGITQFYRLTKGIFGFANISLDGPITIENPILGFVISILLIIFVLIVIFAITILPTLMFNSEQFIKAFLLNKYSEESRKEYGYTTEEWYSKDYGK